MVDTDLSPFVTNTYNEFALSDTTSASTMVGENFPFCIMGAAAKVYFLGTGHTYTFEPTYDASALMNDMSYEFEYTAEGRFPSEAPTASDEPLSSGVYKICHTDYWGAERCTGT